MNKLLNYEEDLDNYVAIEEHKEQINASLTKLNLRLINELYISII
jgi:uncharacterized protein YpmS